MTNTSRSRRWKNTCTSGIGLLGFIIAGVNALLEHFQLGSVLPDRLLLHVVLATTSLCLVLLVVDSSQQDGAFEELRARITAMVGSEISEHRLASTVLARVDEKLRPMFERHLRRVIAEIVSAYETQEVTFSDPVRFKAYYLAVLEAFPPTETLVATSLPLERYFWDGAIESRMGAFVRKRGRSGVGFERVFYVDRGMDRAPETLPDDQRAIIARQLEIGIDVFLHGCEGYPTRLVLVDANATIAWVVETDQDNKIQRITATCNPTQVRLHHDEVMAVRNNSVAVRLVNGRLEAVAT